MTTTKHPPLRAIWYGAGAGVIASLVMATYAMVAAYTKDTGFFTPLLPHRLPPGSRTTRT